mgnify:CR=1 FL=1
MDLLPYLKAMVDKEASDLYFSAGAPVAMKVEGHTAYVTQHPLGPGMAKELAYSVMSDKQRAEFERELELDMAVSVEQLGRFRLNVFMQRGEVALVVRYIKSVIPDVKSLQLPELLNDLIMAPRGLILVVGTTGSGKSTTLASMIDYRNRHKSGYILTIEDPIEYIHHHRKSIVNQREVGTDTRSFHAALKNTLRQAPDVILIGEIRDRETMEHALAFAETGHLAISTLHANNANQALERIINMFPEERRPQLLMGLAQNLRGFVSQRLIPTIEGKRCAAVEIMLGTKTVEDMIMRGEFHLIKEVMEKSENLGMQTFDGALFRLFREGRISLDEALKNADSPNNLRLRIKLADNGGKLEDDKEKSSLLNLSLVSDEQEEEDQKK